MHGSPVYRTDASSRKQNMFFFEQLKRDFPIKRQPNSIPLNPTPPHPIPLFPHPFCHKTENTNDIELKKQALQANQNRNIKPRHNSFVISNTPPPLQTREICRLHLKRMVRMLVIIHVLFINHLKPEVKIIFKKYSSYLTDNRISPLYTKTS